VRQQVEQSIERKSKAVLGSGTKCVGLATYMYELAEED